MKITYYVNESKRTVVAVITNTEEALINKIRKSLKGGLNEFFAFKGYRSYMPDKFVGKAKCAPEDTWDEVYGKQLARERALEKYSRNFNRELADVHARAEELLDIVQDMYELDEEGYIIE